MRFAVVRHVSGIELSTAGKRGALRYLRDRSEHPLGHNATYRERPEGNRRFIRLAAFHAKRQFLRITHRSEWEG